MEKKNQRVHFWHTDQRMDIRIRHLKHGPRLNPRCRRDISYRYRTAIKALEILRTPLTDNLNTIDVFKGM